MSYFAFSGGHGGFGYMGFAVHFALLATISNWPFCYCPNYPGDCTLNPPSNLTGPITVGKVFEAM